MENSKNIYTIIIGIIVVILIGLGIYSFVVKEKKVDYTGTPGAESTGYENKLLAEDQFPGTVAYVSIVSLKKGGFAVVMDEVNGQPGKIIGSKYFAGGTNPGNIDLTEATVEGKSYYIALFDDTNNNKIFDSTTDLPLKDDQGNYLIQKIQATTKLVPQK